MTMEVKKLNAAIDGLKKRNLSVQADIQALGLACIEHLSHGNRDPLNRLMGALTRPQTKPFSEWVMAFAQAKRNTDKSTKATIPFLFDKERTTDLVGAAAKPWFDFAPEKAAAVAEAFDFQAATMAFLKRAAAHGANHAQLAAVAAAVGIPEAMLPKQSAAVAVAAEVGEAKL